MTHVAREKTKLLNRLRRIKGQVEAIERAVDGDTDMRARSSASHRLPRRGGGLHRRGDRGTYPRAHGRPTLPKTDVRVQAAEKLVEIVHSYLV